MGTWYVLGESGKTTYSALWIGIDDGPSDLVQEGTEQEITSICFLGCFTFTSYYGWTEVLPQASQRISNLTVYPGDEMLAEIDMCFLPTSSCLDHPNAPYASLWIWDLTHPQVVSVYDVNTNGVAGTEAEWIMERPLVNGSLPDLSAYVYATMSGAYACNENLTSIE